MQPAGRSSRMSSGATARPSWRPMPWLPPSIARSRARAVWRTTSSNLVLRVGAVPLPGIRARGADVRVGMFEISPGSRVAMFTGGGAALADRLVKGDDHGAYVLPDADSERPDLKGLSCRWETLAARHGHMMCMLASAIAQDPEGRARIYGDLIAEIEQALEPEIDATRPVRPDNMRFRWPPKGLGLETRATRGHRPRWVHALSL